jgi:hypothetical protein
MVKRISLRTAMIFFGVPDDASVHENSAPRFLVQRGESRSSSVRESSLGLGWEG